jgi:ribonucleoside-triphosphate reductase (formate)
MASIEEHDAVVEDEALEVRVPCEIYSRIVGYLRPVQAWNQGKQQEYEERQVFNVTVSEHVES